MFDILLQACHKPVSPNLLRVNTILIPAVVAGVPQHLVSLQDMILVALVSTDHLLVPLLRDLLNPLVARQLLI